MIGSSGVIDLGGGAISLGCRDLQIDGELRLGFGALNDVRHVTIVGIMNGQSGILNLTGDWTKLGEVNSGSSVINMTDGCGTTSSTVSGDTVFFDWTVVTSLGKQINFTAGETQGVLNKVVFNGAAENLLRVRSTVPNNPGFLQLDPEGTQDINYIDVGDNHAPQAGQFMAPGPPEAYNSVDSGGNFRWFFSNRAVPTLQAIPTLRRENLLLLAVLILSLGLIGLKRTQ